MRVWSTIKTISANKNKGFTLVEVMVVIIILGILATLGTISVLSVVDKTKKKVFEEEALTFINAARTKSAETIVPDEGLCYSITDLSSYVEKDLSGYTGSVYVSGDNNYKIWLSKNPYIINSGTSDNMNAIKLASFIEASESCPASFLNITINTNQGIYSGNIPTAVHEGQQIILDTPTKVGYLFTSWTVTGEGSSVNGNILTVGSENLVLSAGWTANSYTLTVNANGGTWSGTTPQTIIYGETATIEAPTRVDYTFTGWTVTGTGSSIDGTTFTMGTENATITANWQLNNRTLTVNANGGTWSGTTPQTILVGNTVTIDNPIKAGYILVGWTVTGSGSNISGTSFTMGTEDATITANWLAYSSMYTYTGSSTIIDDGTGNWRIKFLTSGTFTPLVNMAIDAFLVGGGGAGGGCNNSAGGGGAGGNTYTEFNRDLSAGSYVITIGSGGTGNSNATGSAGGTTSAFGLSALGGGGGSPASSGGYGGQGGSGGGKSGGNAGSYGFDAPQISGNLGKGQSGTTCEFGNGSLIACNSGVSAYSGGGGGGVNGVGGAGGGANGMSDYTVQNGNNGTTNTGGGGSGCWYYGTGSGGTGGSGIVVIRGAKREQVGNTVKFQFNYSGGYSIINGETDNWKIKFLGNGTLKTYSNTEIDVFLVGGGGAGGGCNNSAAGGGAGGYTLTESGYSLLAGNYTITIGSRGIGNANATGNAGGTTSAFGFSAAGGGGGSPASSGGYGGQGGSGGGKSGGNAGSYGSDAAATSGNLGKGQNTTTCEFGQGTLSACNSGVSVYSGGGGGGVNGVGGAGGGANGMSDYAVQNGNNGTIYTGGGGGGCWYFGTGSGGAGGSGIVIIRNHRVSVN